MQFVSQSLFSTLASDEVFQDLEFVNATRLYSLRIVKDITRMIGEHEFIVDLVLTPLAPWLTRSSRSEVTRLLTLTDGSSLTWLTVRSARLAKKDHVLPPFRLSLLGK